MIKERVLPADVFTVVNKTVLNDHDRNLLVNLYQPIIGSTSVSLYYTFWSYLDKLELISNEWTHHHLMNSLRIKLEDIIEARERLEALGLLKSYVKKGNMNSFVYELYSPVDAKEFFNNPVLSMALYSNIGEAEFEKVKSYFKLPKINLKEYEDITVKFNEIYDSSDINNYETLLDEFKHSTKNKLDIISKIDINNVISLIPDEMLNIRSITNSTRDLLHKISFIYNFSEDIMLEILKNSIDSKKSIDKTLLRENAHKYYQFENNGATPNLIYKSQPEYLRKNVSSSSKRAKIIYQFETTTPYDFIASKHNGGRPTKQELSIIEYLLIDLKLNPGVVNVIIDYVLKTSDNKLVRNYVEMVAGLFSRSKVETVEDAMKLAEKEHKNREKYKTISKKEKTVELKPGWFDKEIKTTEISDEKALEMKEMLNKVIK